MTTSTRDSTMTISPVPAIRGSKCMATIACISCAPTATARATQASRHPSHGSNGRNGTQLDDGAGTGGDGKEVSDSKSNNARSAIAGHGNRLSRGEQHSSRIVRWADEPDETETHATLR